MYTAFRDAKTYNSKKRNETWEKHFKISQNSDFQVSVEKDYYIFNFIDKNHVDDGLYLNENSAFYEEYNSGVTCSIYSCINGKRKLYGFLACDSLLDKKVRKSVGNKVYDWNVANMMMSTAHIIALYLERFYNLWEIYCMNISSDLDEWSSKEIIEKQIVDKNTLNHEYEFCNIMKKAVKNTRYSR